MDERFAIPGVDAFTPLSQAAPALLLDKSEPLFALEEAAASGADMDAVHDMRVASRRLRETMRLLEPLYPQPEFRAWYRRVRAITGALGPVRDADVFIDEFSRLAKDLADGGRRAVAFLVGRRMGTREQQLVALNRALAHLDLADSRRSLRKLARSIGASPQAKRSLASFAHAAVAERASIVFGALPGALPQDNVLQQHALRIDFKRLRYAVEVFAPVYGDDFDELHDTLTAFQDTLGDLHDQHLFLDMLREPVLGRQARRAGVSADDLGEVIALLERQAKRTFDAFIVLTAEHPASDLLPALLLPLSRVPEADAAEPADPPAEPTAEPEANPSQAVTVPAAAASEAQTAAAVAPAASGAALAVVIEPAAPVAPGSMPPIDPTAQPWRSDAAGLAIDPPIVIGAEPWARPTLESVTAPADEAPADAAAPEIEEST